MRSRVVGMAVLTVAVAACKPAAPSAQDPAQVQAVVDSANAALLDARTRWMRYANQNHPDSIATLFVAYGVVMPPDVPSAIGRDSITARMRMLTIPGGTLTIISQNVRVSDPVAVNRGVFTYTAPAQGRTPAMNVTGKWLGRWHHSDSTWAIAEITWNNDAPAPPLPAPPARH